MNDSTTPAMHLHRFEFRIVLACLLVCIWAVALAVEGRAQDHSGDREALVALYNATDGDNWANNENWLSDEPLDTWQGVTVSDGRVTGLQLFDNQLAGTIPPELGDLANLTELDLGVNQLTGPIPPELGNLSSLTNLSFGTNELTGSIPSELGNLANLTVLNLNNNQLTGEIPTELGNLSSLEELRLYENQLTGPIPPELGNLSSLSYLNLSDNQLMGTHSFRTG